MRCCMIVLLAMTVLAVGGWTMAQEEETEPKENIRPRRNTRSCVSIFDLAPGLRLKGDVTAAVKEALASEAAQGKTIFFPAGVYVFSDNILALDPSRNQGIEGEGLERTVFRFQGEPKEALITATGDEVKKPPFKQQHWFTLDSLTINTDDTVKVPVIQHRFSSHAYYHRVMFRGAKAGAVVGKSWWDSTFTECHFVNCGNPEDGTAAVHMLDSEVPNSSDRCNNIVLDNCRFEASAGTGIYLGRFAVRCRLRSLKIDRVAVGIRFSEATSCTVSDSQMIGHGDGRGIEVSKSRAIVITGSHFDKLATALDFKQSTGIVSDCTFGQASATGSLRNGEDIAFDAASKRAVKLGVNLWSTDLGKD